MIFLLQPGKASSTKLLDEFREGDEVEEEITDIDKAQKMSEKICK